MCITYFPSKVILLLPVLWFPVIPALKKSSFLPVGSRCGWAASDYTQLPSYNPPRPEQHEQPELTNLSFIRQMFVEHLLHATYYPIELGVPRLLAQQFDEICL